MKGGPATANSWLPPYRDRVHQIENYRPDSGPMGNSKAEFQNQSKAMTRKDDLSHSDPLVTIENLQPSM